jgi:hypothetical protein
MPGNASLGLSSQTKIDRLRDRWVFELFLSKQLLFCRIIPYFCIPTINYGRKSIDIRSL